MDDSTKLTKEESALLITAVIAYALRQPTWGKTAESIFAKLGLTEAAKDTFNHYKERAEKRMRDIN